jgi:hypothetical protein
MSSLDFADRTEGNRTNGGSIMPKRAWCNECKALVILTDEGMCPNGHPRPALQGIEEVAYATQPTERAPRVSDAAVFAPPAPAAVTYGGYDAGPATSYATATPPDSYTATGAGIAQPAEMAMGSAANGVVLDNPWQTGVNSYGIDPELQAKLDADMARIRREVPWTESWAAIIIFLLVFWPIGVAFLWRSSLPTTGVKWGITGGIAALLLFNIIRMGLAFQMATASMAATP